jgi:ectoine hydroxylase
MPTAVLERPAVDLYPSRVENEPRFLERQDPVVYGSAADGPLDAEELKFYEANGYLAFEQLFSESELQPYINELKRLQNDEATKNSDHTITELNSGEVRSIFAVDRHNEVLRKICHHPRLVGIARQLLGSEVYIHQSRINYKPGFKGKEFYWHSDFETWHVEDGMPRMRAVSCSLSLTPNTPNNGPLMVIPGSHKTFLSCVGETPEDHYKHSLKKQEYGVPDEASLTKMVEDGGIVAPIGPAGSVTFFECNIMHGSNSNITPAPRSNIFMVFNSVENTLCEPFCGLKPRPDFIAQREDYSPISYRPESR